MNDELDEIRAEVDEVRENVRLLHQELRKIFGVLFVALPLILLALIHLNLRIEEGHSSPGVSEMTMVEPPELGLATPVPEPEIVRPPESRPKTISKPAVTPTPPKAGDPTKLPNLRIVDIFYDDPYIRMAYENTGGTRVAGDYNVSWSSEGKTFGGNRYYRQEVLPPGEIRASGGLTTTLIGVRDGETKKVSVTIDSENRVRESNENDNVASVVITHGKEASNRGSLEYSSPPELTNYPDSELPDLVISHLNFRRGQKHHFLVSNQGDRGSSRRFSMVLAEFDSKKVLKRFDNCEVPSPGASESYDLSEFNLKNDTMIVLELDPENKVQEAREDNNRFIRQVNRNSIRRHADYKYEY